MKIKMKMKNISHRYYINRPRSRQGHKYSKYNKCLSMILFLCIKQRWGWVEKIVAYKKYV